MEQAAAALRIDHLLDRFDPAVDDAIHYRFAQEKLHFFDRRTEENLLESL